MRVYLISLLLHLLFPACQAYRDFECPHVSELRLRAKGFCQKYGLKVENYGCLFDEIVNAYLEVCNFQAVILDPGDKFVINHRPKSVKCTKLNRYQPFGLQRLSGDCVYHRSMCSEPGQIRFHDGSTTVDRSCRCNFDQGYAFVSTTVRQCYCTPSTEDCSCYLKRCPENFKLSSDYLCIHRSNFSYFPSCPGMNNQERKNSDMTLIRRHVLEPFVYGLQYHWLEPFTFIAVCTVIFGATYALYIVVQDKMPYICSINMSLSPPIELATSVANGCLTLAWTSPQDDSTEIDFYKILYTSNEWHDQYVPITVNAKQLSCIIPNIYPQKTYRFKISSCVGSIEGTPSKELMFMPRKPNQSSDLRVEPINGNLKVVWTSPLEDLFKTESYVLEVTIADTDVTDTFSVPGSSKLQYIIKDFKQDRLYRFKLFTVSHSVKSDPIEITCTTSPRFFVWMKYKAHGDDDDDDHHNQNKDGTNHDENRSDLGFYKPDDKVNGADQRYNGPVQTDGRHDTNSASYLTLKETIGNIFRDCPGNQIITELRLKPLCVDFILISKRCSDEEILRNALEKSIKTGTLGKLSISMDGLIFHALDNPDPPQIDHVENVVSGITLSWTKPLDTSFKIKSFVVQFTTRNEWSKCKTIETLADQYQCSILIDRPFPQYRFRIFTRAQNAVNSLPSQEINSFAKGLERLHYSESSREEFTKFEGEYAVEYLQEKLNRTLNEWKDHDLMFRPNRATRQVLKSVDEYNCVTITSTTGFGKTATLRHVTLQMAEKGFNVIIVVKPDDIVRFYNPNKKTLFIIDDLCGKSSLNQTDIRIWEPFTVALKTIISKPYTKMIVTCRLEVYNNDKFKPLTVFNSCVCNLSSYSICVQPDGKVNEKSSMKPFNAT